MFRSSLGRRGTGRSPSARRRRAAQPADAEALTVDALVREDGPQPPARVARVQSIDSFTYIQSALITPLFLLVALGWLVYSVVRVKPRADAPSPGP